MATRNTPYGTEDCVVCGEISGEIAVPGGALHSCASSLVIHVPPLENDDVYLGHLLAVPRRHVADFASLSDIEATDIGIMLQRASASLKRAGASRVYVATIGHAQEHLHVHLLPRWPETPDDVAWHSVDDWPGARRATFAQAAQFSSRLTDE